MDTRGTVGRVERETQNCGRRLIRGQLRREEKLDLKDRDRDKNKSPFEGRRRSTEENRGKGLGTSRPF